MKKRKIGIVEREADLQKEITRQLHRDGGVRLSVFMEWLEAVREMQGRRSRGGNLDLGREQMRQFGLPIIDDCGSA